MAKVHKFRVSSTRSNDLVCRSMAAAEAKGTMMRRAGHYCGRFVELDGRMLRNLGTCSYLGFDKRPELKRAAIAATEEYGTQFSISRAYLECALYQELEMQSRKNYWTSDASRTLNNARAHGRSARHGAR